MAPTPKSQGRKRKLSAVDNNTPETPAKKRLSKNKETVINLDVEDPFNFEKKEDSHPEPLKNISIERTAFGGVKFFRSPPTVLERYISVEKIAERRGNVSGTVTSPISTSRPSGSLSSLGTSFSLQLTPHSANTSSAVATPKSSKKKKTPGNSNLENLTTNNKQKKEVNTPVNTSQTSAKRRSRSIAFEASATPKEKKLTIDGYCIVPNLTPEEQMLVDHDHQSHKLLDAGARVMALWGDQYYAANICGRDGLSRYYVHFVEDNLNRQLPPNGVVPLSALTEGKEVSFITVQNNEEMGKLASIVTAPSSTKAQEWSKGQFKLHVENEGEYKNVSWEKIYLTKEQYKVINASAINTTVEVEEENIVNESRSSRRTRSARFSLDNSNVNSLSTATPRAKTAKILKTPKTPAIKEQLDSQSLKNTEEDEEKFTEETNEKLKSNKKPAKKLSNTSTIDLNASKASTISNKTPVKTPARSRQRTKVVKTPVEEAKENGNEKQINEDVDEKNDEATNAEEQKNIETEEFLKSTEETKKVEDLNEIENTTIGETNEKNKSLSEKMEVDEKNDEDSDKITENSNTDNNSLSEKLQTNGLTTTMPKTDLTMLTENVVNNTLQNSKLINDVKLNKDVMSLPSDKNNVKSSLVNESENANSADALTVTKTEPIKSHLQEISISSIAPPTTDEEASIFKGMKFVLTSATRSKKNSDFQKRDYRLKIEERGGVIIDDFSSINENDRAFLVADTYYRTHKYLSALSISVPCVKHYWILACVTEKRLVDHNPYMLPAGESSLDQSKICEWKPLKNTLLQDKCVWVYSNIPTRPDERAIGFVDIWSSIIKNLGATIVEENFTSLVEKLDYCANHTVDILLTDNSCEKELAERVDAEGGIAVSSEWVIQAIVTGEIPDVNSAQRFRFDTGS